MAIIDLFGELRSKARTGMLAKGANRDALYLSIEAPDLVGVFDDEWLAMATAVQIQEVIKFNALSRGLDPSGNPLPRVDADTLERREYRAEQAARSGAAHKKYRKRKRKARVFEDAKKNYHKRFYAPRVEGHSRGIHVPSPGTFRGDLVGLESGLLFRSTKAAPLGPGRWGVFFANVRALKDYKGGSALERVFSRFPVWSQKAMRQPAMQRQLALLGSSIVTQRKAAEEIIAAVRAKDVARLNAAMSRASQKVGRGRDRFFAALRQTVSSLGELGSAVESFDNE